MSGCAVRFSGTPNESDVARHGDVQWQAPAVVTTGNDGTFEIRFVPPPSYEHFLEVKADGRMPRVVRRSAFHAGEVWDLGDIGLAVGAQVHGRVVDEAGKGMAEATVSISGIEAATRAVMGTSDVHTNTMADGTFAFCVPTGRFYLQVHKQGVVFRKIDLIEPAYPRIGWPDSPDSRRRPAVESLVVEIHPSTNQVLIRVQLFPTAIERLRVADAQAPSALKDMWQWLQEHEALLFWLGVLSIGSLLLVGALLPIILVRMPADYFVREHDPGHGPRRVVDWVWHIGKNVLGAVFILAGIAMLVLPGQGLLTILIGFLMMDLPGKRRLERWLICRPGVLKVLNEMRRKRGREPLQT